MIVTISFNQQFVTLNMITFAATLRDTHMEQGTISMLIIVSCFLT
jgi:hypothetical protein